MRLLRYRDRDHHGGVRELEDEERLYAVVRNCARSGESWVACDAAGRIVGFVLVEAAQLRRHYAEGEALELRYAGVAPDCRQQGVFTRLLDKALARMLPVSMSVSPQNRSGIVWPCPAIPSVNYIIALFTRRTAS